MGGSFYVDPMVTLDPAWVAANPIEAASLSFNFGDIPNLSMGPPDLGVSAVPEPSTWAMMLIGFAGLGYGGVSAGEEDPRDRHGLIETQPSIL